jgi:hypothetical protein
LPNRNTGENKVNGEEDHASEGQGPVFCGLTELQKIQGNYELSDVLDHLGKNTVGIHPI